MIPTGPQYKKWSLPNKWSFWAAFIGIPIGITSFALTLFALLPSNDPKEELARLLLQTAQELRYNHEWLTSVSHAETSGVQQVPSGSIKTRALMSLTERHHLTLIEHAYGEEKHIYQLALRLEDLGIFFGSPTTSLQVSSFNHRSDYSLHDIHFLNNFLLWYITPLIVEKVDTRQIYSLGRNGLPDSEFKIDGISKLRMKHFIDEGRPLQEFLDFLGLID